MLAFKNRTASIEDDRIDQTNNATATCEVIFDVSVLSPNFNKSKEGIAIIFLIEIFLTQASKEPGSQ